MPPRTSLFPSLRALNGTDRLTSVSRTLQTLTQYPASLPSSASQSRPFTCSATDQASTVAQKKRHRDPYATAQARARKSANLSRQEVLKKERASALGDPVRGITTPFVQSFDTALPPNPAPQDAHTATQNASSSEFQPPPGPNAQNDTFLNFFLKSDDIKTSVVRSELLNAPLPSLSSDSDVDYIKPSREEQHATATEALNRIASLSNGSSKDRLRVNIQRCISAFGRHNTDARLPPKATLNWSVLSQTAQESNAQKKVERVGVDTGSSEVQVAILTAKIRTLADFLETRGKTDKVNKRNLRVLVHKRQKLLSYLRRKERGGPRWQNLIETLGLTEGTWRGEISL